LNIERNFYGPDVNSGGAASGGPIVNVVVTQSIIIAPKSKIVLNRLFLKSFFIFFIDLRKEKFSQVNP